MEKFAKIEHGAVKVETPVSATPAATTTKIVMPAPKPKNDGGSPSDSWMPWVLGGGGALLAHALTSPMFEASEEEKRKESVWSKLLRTIIPLGVGGIGGVAGYALGNELSKNAQAMSTNEWDRVVGKNGRFATITPPQYSEALDQLLQYVDDNDGTKWEDIVRIANELQGADNSLERNAGEGLRWGALVPAARGAYKTVQGIAQIHGSRPEVIQARYQKALANIPPARPGAAPVRKWYNPTTWDMFSKGVVKGDARRTMIANMRQAASQSMQTATRNAPDTAAKGWKNLGKGLMWSGVATGLEHASGILADEAANRGQAASTAEEFLKIRNKLEEMMRNSKVVPENVSTNAPVATSRGTAK